MCSFFASINFYSGIYKGHHTNFDFNCIASFPVAPTRAFVATCLASPGQRELPIPIWPQYHGSQICILEIFI